MAPETKQSSLLGLGLFQMGKQFSCCPCLHYNSQAQIIFQSICYHCLSCTQGRGWAGTLPVTLAEGRVAPGTS